MLLQDELSARCNERTSDCEQRRVREQREMSAARLGSAEVALIQPGKDTAIGGGSGRSWRATYGCKAGGWSCVTHGDKELWQRDNTFKNSEAVISHTAGHCHTATRGSMDEQRADGMTEFEFESN